MEEETRQMVRTQLKDQHKLGTSVEGLVWNGRACWNRVRLHIHREYEMFPNQR